MNFPAPARRLSGIAWVLLLLSHSASFGQEVQPAAPADINPAEVEKLVKYAIIAIDQGNATGNYSVLRELGTAKFQATTSSARLSDAFARLRKMKLDMSALLMLKPKFTKPPTFENGSLRIVGFFPTKPIHISFSISYAQQDGLPRIAGLVITPIKATAEAGEAATESGKVDKAEQQ